MQPDATERNGNIYFNGTFKWVVGGVIVAMWGLLVLFGTSFAKSIEMRVEKNTFQIIELKVGLGVINQKLDDILARMDRDAEATKEYRSR